MYLVGYVDVTHGTYETVLGRNLTPQYYSTTGSTPVDNDHNRRGKERYIYTYLCIYVWITHYYR